MVSLEWFEIGFPGEIVNMQECPISMWDHMLRKLLPVYAVAAASGLGSIRSGDRYD